MKKLLIAAAIAALAATASFAGETTSVTVDGLSCPEGYGAGAFAGPAGEAFPGKSVIGTLCVAKKATFIKRQPAPRGLPTEKGEGYVTFAFEDSFIRADEAGNIWVGDVYTR